MAEIEARHEPRRRAGQSSLVFTVLGEYGLDPDPGQTDADLDDIEAVLLRARGACSTYSKPKPARSSGLMASIPWKTGTCELRKMYLRTDHRGQGLGKRLMNDALENARQLGFKQIVLETASVLKEAIALYKRYGFAPCQTDHLSPRCDQAYSVSLALTSTRQSRTSSAEVDSPNQMRSGIIGSGSSDD